MSRLARDEMAEPVSRDQILRREREQGNIIFPCSVQLNTRRNINHTRLIYTLLQVMTIPYIHLSLSSRLTPSARLRATVDVPTRALWLAGIFLRRKKRCTSVVGTRTNWVLKGEEG